jgi:curved DNA-binding protein CbpA
MSKIEIDFNNLKYNLYEILNISADSDEKKIKKHFMKIIKTFHPDKNSDLEEDIYYHIILANQILLNKDSRKRYDEYIKTKSESFNELKTQFNKSVDNIEKFFPEKNNSNTVFKDKFNELNKKHGYNEFMNENMDDKFKKLKNSRETPEIKIQKEDIKNISEFNNIFNTNKSSGKFTDVLVYNKSTPSELSTYVLGENYTNLVDIDKLYIEDSIQTTKYSSLDRAFMLHPQVNNINNKSLDDKMKEYVDNSKEYNSMRPTDFSIKKFNEWTNI